MIDNQRSDVEKINLIGKCKKLALMKLLSAMKLLLTVWNHKYKIESYCVRCKKYTKSLNPRVSNTRNGKTMILSKCASCCSKKSRFIENQEAKGLLSNLVL